MSKLYLKFRNALIIETSDEDTYEVFGTDGCGNDMSVNKENIDSIEEYLFDRYYEDEYDEEFDGSGEDYETVKLEVIPKCYIEFIDLIKEKLETFSEVQVKKVKKGV